MERKMRGGVKSVRRALSARGGASLVPYGLVVGLIGVLALLSVTTLGEEVADMFDRVSLDLPDVAGGGNGSGDDDGGEGEGGGPVLAGNPSSQTVNQTGLSGQCAAVDFRNTGDAPVEGLSAPSLSPGADYTLSGCVNGCTGSLAPGASCQVEVKGTGSANAQSLSGTLTLAASSGGTAEVTLSGTVFAPGGMAVSLGGGGYSSGMAIAFDGTGYALAAATTDFSGFPPEDDPQQEMLIARFRSDGTLDWASSVGAAAASELPTSIAWDGSGYVVGGFTTLGGEQTLAVLRLTSSGALDWARTVGVDGAPETGGFISLGGGGIALAGDFDPSGLGDPPRMLLAHLSADGQTIDWAKGFAGTDSQSVTGIAGNGSGYLLVGQGNDTAASNLGIAAAVDGDGGLQWVTEIYGSHQTSLRAATADGSGWAVTGFTESDSGDFDIVVTRLSSTGAVLWRRVLGESSHDYGMAITRDSGGGFAVAGWTTGITGPGYENAYIAHLTSGGTNDWTTIAGVGHTNSFFQGVLWDGQGYAAAGDLTTGGHNELLFTHIDTAGAAPGCGFMSGASLPGLADDLSDVAALANFTSVDAPSLASAALDPPDFQAGDWSGDASPPDVTTICP
jgi:hypothetical protein